MILLDTHIVIWLLHESSKLSKRAASAIESAHKSGGGLCLSAVTLVEIAGLAAKERISLRTTPDIFFRELESRFIVQPITGRVCAETLRLPASYPKDPMDRIIGATALVEEMTLITADAAIQDSKAVRTLW